MRTVKTIMIMLVLAIASSSMAWAQYFSDRKHDSGTDTLMVYNSWRSLYYTGPDTVAVNPNIEVYSPFHFKFKPTEKSNKVLKKMIEKTSPVVAIGDTVWLVNSRFLADSLAGPYNRYLDDYLPLYFNNKILFFQFIPTDIDYLYTEIDNFEGLDTYVGVGRSSVLEYNGGYSVADVAHFVIDLSNREVFLVDKTYLLYLLDFYPDMKRRFEMMHDQNEFYLINEFFWDFVDRISSDPSYPEIKL